MSTFQDIKAILLACFAMQERSVVQWHMHPPDAIKTDLPCDAENGSLVLIRIAEAQHAANFQLWHIEDDARRRDVDDSVIADCKHRIDVLNQNRNDLIERFDTCLVAVMQPLLPENSAQRYNTETIGAALDRMSILSLKIFHMRENSLDEDLEPDLRTECSVKLEILIQQREDLGADILLLLDEYASGQKQPRVYYQFKTYNDPLLNPALRARTQKTGC